MINTLNEYYDNIDSLYFEGVETDSLIESFQYSMDRICSESYLIPIHEGFLQSIWTKIKNAIDRVINFIKKIFNDLKTKLSKSSGGSKSKSNNSAQQSTETMSEIEKIINDLEQDMDEPDIDLSFIKGDDERKAESKKTTNSASSADTTQQSSKPKENEGSNENTSSSQSEEPKKDVKTYTKEQVRSMMLNDKTYKDIRAKLKPLVKEKNEIKAKLRETYKKIGLNFDEDIAYSRYESQHIKILYDSLPNDASITLKVNNNGLAGYFIANKPFYELFTNLHPDETADKFINWIDSIVEKSKDNNFSGNIWDVITDCGISSGDSEEDIKSKIGDSLLATYLGVKEINNNANWTQLMISSVNGGNKYLSVLGKEIKIGKDILTGWCDYIINQSKKKSDVFVKKLFSDQERIQSKFIGVSNKFKNADLDPKCKKIVDVLVNSIIKDFYSEDMIRIAQTLSVQTFNEQRIAHDIVDKFLDIFDFKSLRDSLKELESQIKTLQSDYTRLKKKYNGTVGKPVKESYFDIDFY